MAVQRLPRRQRLKRAHDLVRGENLSVLHVRHRAKRLGETLDPAQAATGRSSHVTATAGQGRVGPRLGQPHAQLNTDILLDDLELADFFRRGDDSLGETEADRKVVQILRRRHHHGVRRAVVGKGDGGLFRNDTLAFGDVAISPDHALDRRNRPHRITPPLRAARSGGSGG